jgi:indole-3-glycerol phosphate synthase
MDNRKLLEVLERAIERLEEKRKKIKDEIKKQEIEKWEKKKNEGWIPFVFKTAYEDNDGERSIIVDYYALSPNREFKNIKSEEDLKSMKKGDYYYFNDETIFQAVWPEKYITNDE